MKLKRIIAAALSLMILGGCNGATPSATDENGSEPPAAAEPAKGEIRDISSMELIGELTAGWNLGNTLDATGKTLSSETAWGNPTTTKEMFDKVKEAGFDLIRIPVTWEGHMDSENNIDPEWMERVKTVVDYAIDDDTYVIINLHHEEWNNPFYDNKDAACAKIKSVWAQIAECFKDYDEHLIFEGQNEPRQKRHAQRMGRRHRRGLGRGKRNQCGVC